MGRRNRRLMLYVAGIIGAGGAALIGVYLYQGMTFAHGLATYSLLVAAVVLGEFFPVTVTFRNEKQDITTATTFVFATLLLYGLGPAILAQGVASAASDLGQRKVWWKAAFNVSQYALSWGVAGAVLIVGGAGPGEFREATAFTHSGVALVVLAAAGAFMFTNSVLIGAAVALAQDLPVVRNLRHHLGFYLWASSVLFSLSPIVVVIALADPILIPLLLAPLAATYRSAQVSIDKEHQATHDALTELPNRTYFRERVDHALRDRQQRGASVLIIDLDHFKEVNDTLGHQIGDQLLQEIARRLSGAVQDDDLVARLGGDEFAVLTHTNNPELAAELASSILSSLEEPLQFDDLEFEIGASIGASLYPHHGTEVGDLLRKADVAMYWAKERRNSFELYEPERDRHSARRLTLLTELRHGIDNNELVLHYQPKADLATGRIVGAEALVRWQHNEHGLLFPDEFIPLAEPTGLMGPLTNSVLTDALQQCQVWNDAGLELKIAVNVSVRNLYDEQFPRTVERLLHRFNVAPGTLTLEITESTMMADPRRPLATLSHLNMSGVRLAIDDFGTGYSSLAYLKRLPVTEIKIDRSFVMNMIDDKENAAIVYSTIKLARDLGIEVVAEGVEHEDAWNVLAAHGCHRAQGYYLSPALPPEGFVSWLATYEANREATSRATPRMLAASIPSTV